MAELVPVPFADLVTRLYLEPRRQNCLFELPRNKWYLPAKDGPDLSVAFHGERAGNAAGPAAGPHTQMAQNLLLSYVAGGRILELKTVQVNDRLSIGRPCIDMTNVGYNIEWSQELLVEDSLREYVAGAMLIEMFRRSRQHSGGLLDGVAGEVLYDISVGYDLAGIRSEKVCGFLDGMRDASAVVERLRDEIPVEFKDAAGLEFPTCLSESITLSTFHGCPAEEIEKICEFLIGDMGFDVIVKMNPPTLGKERLEHLLHDVLGYTELVVNPTAYTSVISFGDSVELCHRLTAFGKRRGRCVGFKFSNTLEVMNHRDFFTADNKVMYLSGQPLHVITMTLTDEFRRAVGPDVPISFSAGVDQRNFAQLVACGFVPITSSTDLLRPGGYTRMGKYLDGLTQEMQTHGVSCVDEYICGCFGNGEDAERRVAALGGQALDVKKYRDAVVRWAGLLNTSVVAEFARNEPRYRADRNRSVPKRIESTLKTFDCITCDKCLPVCPNAANFTYPTPIVEFEFQDVVVATSKAWGLGEVRRFVIEQTMQIACFADFCNECGNCDTFCPEYGGPYIKKPSFFGSVESWVRASPRDGFVIGTENGNRWIRGRIQGREFELTVDDSGDKRRFRDGPVTADFTGAGILPSAVSVDGDLQAEFRLDLWAYHTMRHLLFGVLDRSRINQVNVAFERS